MESSPRVLLAAGELSLSPAAPPPVNPLDTLAADPLFSPFLSSDFSAAAFSSAALSSGSAASRAESLAEAIRLLSSHLRAEVLSRHPSLLSSLLSLRQLTPLLSSLRPSASSLLASLHRARLDLSAPHAAVNAHTAQLANLMSTADLMLHSSRLMRLATRSREAATDVARCAEIHREIRQLYEEKGLAGITVVEEEMRTIKEDGVRLRAEAAAAVERGMATPNQNDVWCGLQVYYNLGELQIAVDAIVNKYKTAGVKSVNAALDMKAISVASSTGGFGGPGGVQRSGTPQIGGSKKAAEGLWERMKECVDELHRLITAVWQLQTVLTKKRVPFTQILFLEEVWQEGEPLLTERVWEAIVKAFASQMKSAFTASSFVKEIFTLGYPRLYSMVENLLDRISRDTEVKGTLPALSAEGKDQIISSIETFQTAFLGLCLSRLSDYVNTVFPVSSRGTIPSKDQISRIVSRIQEEIEVVRTNGHLLVLVLHEIRKVLLLLAERAEYQVSTGPEARQVTGPATPAQLKNFALCQHLQEIHARISNIESTLQAVASEVLSAPLGTIYGVACDSVTSLFQAMLDRLESFILQIHGQEFGIHGAEEAMDNGASSYMEDLQKSCLHFRSEFLSKLLPPTSAPRPETICTRFTRRMASRVLIFYIRHAALVRPLSEAGKLRMARDMAELEMAVGQNLYPVEQLGAPYRALRAFRPVIFLETSELENSPLLQDLPPSVILHHLYSRGPDDLQSPLQRNKLTPTQYSLWLDSQGEDQIWKGIKVTLDDYKQKLQARGNNELSPAYTLMLQIGSSAFSEST